MTYIPLSKQRKSLFVSKSKLAFSKSFKVSFFVEFAFWKNYFCFGIHSNQGGSEPQFKKMKLGSVLFEFRWPFHVTIKLM